MKNKNPAIEIYGDTEAEGKRIVARSDAGTHNGKVILTVPGAEIADAVMGCGSTTGRDTDKAAKFTIELASLPGSAIQVPAHSRVAIQCHMKKVQEVATTTCRCQNCDRKGAQR